MYQPSAWVRLEALRVPRQKINSVAHNTVLKSLLEQSSAAISADAARFDPDTVNFKLRAALDQVRGASQQALAMLKFLEREGGDKNDGTHAMACAPPSVSVNGRVKFQKLVHKSVITAPHSAEALKLAIGLGSALRRTGLAYLPTTKRRRSVVDASPLCRFTRSVMPSDSTVIIMDLETTGFRPCGIVELGAIIVNTPSRLATVATPSVEFQSRVNPGIEISADATTIHGITNTAVERESTFDVVWSNFLTWVESHNLGTSQIVILTYNGLAFDFRVLVDDLWRFALQLPPSWMYADLLKHVDKCVGYHKIFSGFLDPSKNKPSRHSVSRLLQPQVSPETSNDMVVGSTVPSNAVVSTRGHGNKRMRSGRSASSQHKARDTAVSTSRTLRDVYFAVFKEEPANQHSAIGDARAVLRLFREALSQRIQLAVHSLTTSSRAISPEMSRTVNTRPIVKKGRVLDNRSSTVTPSGAILPTAIIAANASFQRILRVLGLFGIDETRSRELLTVEWAAAMNPTKTPHCKLVSNDALVTLQGCLRGDVLFAYSDLVARASDGKCLALDDMLTLYMPCTTRHQTSVFEALTREMGRRHLSRTHLGAVHLPGHWIATITELEFDGSKKLRSIKETLLDPLGRDRSESDLRTNVLQLHTRWHQKVHNIADDDVASFISTQRNPENLSCQNDGISCGVFVAVYFYFYVMYGRFPTTDDFDGTDQFALRLAMLDAILRGRVRRPLSQAGQVHMEPATASRKTDIIDLIKDDAAEITRNDATACPGKIEFDVSTMSVNIISS